MTPADEATFIALWSQGLSQDWSPPSRFRTRKRWRQRYDVRAAKRDNQDQSRRQTNLSVEAALIGREVGESRRCAAG